MARAIDPRNLPIQNVTIPELKSPVWDFSPCDDGDPQEVDAFNHMIRELNQSPPNASRG